MGGAPPLPLDFAPDTPKKGTFFAFFRGQKRPENGPKNPDFWAFFGILPAPGVVGAPRWRKPGCPPATLQGPHVGPGQGGFSAASVPPGENPTGRGPATRRTPNLGDQEAAPPKGLALSAAESARQP